MKRASIVFFITFLFLIIMSACKENEYMDWKHMNDRWYSIHKNDSGYITTSSGLCYQVVHQGYQRKPNIGSAVVVTYRGTLIDGSVFDSTATDATTSMYLSNAIKGWQEGIVKMNVGGCYRFYVPYSLGYGSTNSTTIPAYSVLRFEVNLVDAYY